MEREERLLGITFLVVHQFGSDGFVHFPPLRSLGSFFLSFSLSPDRICRIEKFNVFPFVVSTNQQSFLLVVLNFYTFSIPTTIKRAAPETHNLPPGGFLCRSKRYQSLLLLFHRIRCLCLRKQEPIRRRRAHFSNQKIHLFFFFLFGFYVSTFW